MRRVRRRVIAAMAALGFVGLVSWVLMLLPPVNDAVLGDLPRGLGDFTRMCEDGRNGEPFPRAALYEPGAGRGPHPWVVISGGIDVYSSTGTETKEPDWGEGPDPAAVQLVACSEVSGAVSGTEITCQYTDRYLGGDAEQTVEFSQGRYSVAVIEARTGDLVGKGTVKGDDKVECDDRVVAGDTEPVYTGPTWSAYADLLADIPVAPSGS